MIYPNLKCYNFVSQHVSSLPNESITFCSTNSQFINVRKDVKSKGIYVEISDLHNIESIQNRFSISFQNVDKIIYSNEGNYIAIVGLDTNQFAKICIYFNWWLEPPKSAQSSRSKCILNLYDESTIDNDVKIRDKDMRSGTISKPALEYVEIKTDFFREEEAKRVKIGCCKQSGNMLIGYVNKIQIFKYFKRYSIDDRSLTNNFVHLIDVEIKFDAKHFTLTEQLLLCSSTEHCQMINLDFHAEIHLNSSIKLEGQSKLAENSKLESNENFDEQLDSNIDNEETIYLPIFQNEQLKVPKGYHLNEIIGPIEDRYCCRIDVKFDSCLQVNTNNINILFCLNLTPPRIVPVEQQFEIIEEDGYSQIFHRDNDEMACKTFLLPVYNQYSDHNQLNEKNNPLAEIENRTQNLLHSSYNSKLIYFNFFVFKNDNLLLYLINHKFKIEKFRLNQFNTKNFNLQNVSIDESIYILINDSLYTYYFGIFDILNNVHQLKFTSILNQNLNELLKIIQPLLLNKNSFPGSYQLINTSVQLIILSQDDQTFTKYSLKKPSNRQLLNDAKENLIVLEQQLNQNEKINFYFYLINLCKSVKLDAETECFYLDYCLKLLKLLIKNFSLSSTARRLIIEFTFKYTSLTICDLIEKDQKFLYQNYEEGGKSILGELIEHLMYEDTQSQIKLQDSLYDYEKQKLLSKRVLDKLDDANVIKIIKYLTVNSKLVVYIVFKHQFKKSNWSPLLMDNISLFNTWITKSKLIFDCEQFEELEKLVNSTNEMTIYSELINHNEIIVPSIDYLAYLVKLDLAKVIRFLHKLISSNISSEFIFIIFKDNKLLFVLLDNYLCTTRSEQIAEKLITNLVVNYWKILNGELNYDALYDELELKHQWTMYQTPFINLLRPYHDEEELKSGLDNTFNKLQFILNNYSSNHEIKSLLNHLIKNSKTSWSWRIQVQISEFTDAISILYDKRPETILFYILEHQTMNNEKWRLLIDFLDIKQRIHGLDSKLNHKVLYHLANILSPMEFIKLIPTDWNLL